VKWLTGQQAAALSPYERRERIVASYMAGFQAQGIAADPLAVERMVVSDMQLVDHAQPAPAKAKRARSSEPKPPRRARHANPAGAAVRSRITDGDPLLVSAKWGGAVRRFGQILQTHGKASSIVLAIADAEVESLAKQAAEVWGFYMTRGRPPPPGIDHNPFRGMSTKDASLKLMRLVEDICDRSTGRMGPWWVR